MTKFHKVV